MAKVYIRIDSSGRITDVNSSAFIAETDGWTEIDEGEGDRYFLAQGNYFPLPITDGYGVYRYKLADGVPVERTAEETENDRPEPCDPGPSTAEQLRMLTDCVLELSEIVCA